MAQNANIAATANEVSNQPKSATNAKSATTQRVVENREMWAVVFDHTATLLALAIKGEALPEDATAGFAFGKTTGKDGKSVRLAAKQQPNIRGYFYSLIAAFGSRKAIKHSKGTVLEEHNLEEVGRKVCLDLWSKFDYDAKVGKAEPKQAKSLVEAVIAKL
jgi:hypothetical protein